jgi:hypothetical protein
MENKKLLIGAGVVVIGYLLWKKSQTKSVAKTDVFTPQVKMGENALPVVELDWSILSKIPNEFTVKSNGFNTRYYKNIDKNLTGFASQFSVPELYKQPYSTTGVSGVMPTKISTREFSDAYSVFLKQPK